MRIFSDVDYTLIGVDGTLRSGTREAFQTLIDQGHEIYLWSTMGERHEIVAFHGLEDLVSGVYAKADCPIVPDMVLDDYPEMVSKFGGIWTTPYFDVNYDDNIMDSVVGIVNDMTSVAGCHHPNYQAIGSDIPNRDVKDTEIVCGPLVGKLAKVVYLWSYDASRRGIVEVLDEELTGEDNIILAQRPELLM